MAYLAKLSGLTNKQKALMMLKEGREIHAIQGWYWNEIRLSATINCLVESGWPIDVRMAAEINPLSNELVNVAHYRIDFNILDDEERLKAREAKRLIKKFNQLSKPRTEQLELLMIRIKKLNIQIPKEKKKKMQEMLAREEFQAQLF